MGAQGDSEHVNSGDTSTVGDSGIIMGAPISSMSTASGAGGGDESAVMTPTWYKNATG